MTEWIKWDGGKCPIPPHRCYSFRRRNGEELLNDWHPEDFNWGRYDVDTPTDIVAYRIEDDGKFKPPATVQEMIAWRKGRGLSQSDLAALLGVPIATMNHVEQGMASYRWVYALAIAYIEDNGLYRGAPTPTTYSGLTEHTP